MSPTVDNLSVQITASANGAVSAINRLAVCCGAAKCNIFKKLFFKLKRAVERASFYATL